MALPATVLCVDDEPAVLNAMRRLFRPRGYRILQAASGTEGLAVLRENPVDLIISDMRMPNMDGAQFLEAARQHDPGIVRILLTGYADISATIAAINRGEIHRYIAKPWDDHDLLLVVQEALTRRDLEHQNTRLQALTQAQNDELKVLNHTLEARVAARTAELAQVNDMLTTAFEDLSGNFTLALTVFSGLMEMRQGGIAGHSRRVAALVKRVCARLPLDSGSQQDIYLAALLHDIGKIGFPDKMLGKPVSALGPEELSRYRRHPLDGEAALMPLARLHGAARMIRQHHERVDGHGFPDGLAGDEIVLGARIIAVVSDYDDLIHGGIAEQHYTPEMALRTLRGCVDSRYDRPVFEAFVEALAEVQTEPTLDVVVEVKALAPGMILAQDLLAPTGAILLAAGYVFDTHVIRRLSEFGARENLKFTLRILRESIKAPAGRVAEAAH